MKKLIFTIGTALSTLTGFANNAHTNNPENPIIVYIVQDTVTSPLSIASEKTAEEIIAEDNKITESTIEAASPLNPGKSLESIVTEDNQVVETVNGKTYPLDFKKINQKQGVLKIKTGKRLIGSL